MAVQCAVSLAWPVFVCASDSCCICYSEVSSTLHQLGCDTESEDDLLEQIRSEVKRLGTQQSIKQDLVCLERRDMTNYVIKRPQLLPSTRDYLTDKRRYAGVHPDPHRQMQVQWGSFRSSPPNAGTLGFIQILTNKRRYAGVHSDPHRQTQVRWGSFGSSPPNAGTVEFIQILTAKRRYSGVHPDPHRQTQVR